jgi:hypothetical protein
VQLEHFVSRHSVGGVQKGAAGTGWIEETLESALCGAQWLRAPRSWRHVVGGRTICALLCLSRAQTRGCPVTHFAGLVDMHHLSLCLSSMSIDAGNAVRGSTCLRGVSSVAAVFP